MIDLEQILRKYQRSKKEIQTHKKQLKSQIEQQVESMTINALKLQNHKVSEIHKNQQIIQTKLKRNKQTRQQMQKQLGTWIRLYEELNKSLKKAGDLAHYANFVQDQVRQVQFQINEENKGKTYQSILKNMDD